MIFAHSTKSKKKTYCRMTSGRRLSDPPKPTLHVHLAHHLATVERFAASGLLQAPLVSKTFQCFADVGEVWRCHALTAAARLEKFVNLCRSLACRKLCLDEVELGRTHVWSHVS